MSVLAALSQSSNIAPEPAAAPELGNTETFAPITIPAGTHLLMKLTSPLHSTSATPGSGVYLETSAPVIADDRVAIPENTRVFGVVEKNRRPGRTHGRAQLRLRFTQFILPDNRAIGNQGSIQ